MHHWRAGRSLAQLPRVCGRPCGHWLSLFLLSHARERQGWRRLEWPDGEALLQQSWPMVQVFQMIAEELVAADMAEVRRANTHRPPYRATP